MIPLMVENIALSRQLFPLFTNSIVCGKMTPIFWLILAFGVVPRIELVRLTGGSPDSPSLAYESGPGPQRAVAHPSTGRPSIAPLSPTLAIRICLMH